MSNFQNLEAWENRGAVLDYSLLIEKKLSDILCLFLNIDDAGRSRSFGNKSTALSFSQKLLILADVNLLESEDRSRLLKFMEVRNQFMHNYDCSTFEQCANVIDGLKNFLDKRFPFEKSNDLDSEKQLAVQFEKLGNYLLAFLFDLYHNVYVGKGYKLKVVE